jgi:hypothetical protein
VVPLRVVQTLGGLGWGFSLSGFIPELRFFILSITNRTLSAL